ncbi:WXG100 family type VII secretion target [Lentzea rhizosphaerae]|uniref:WXG100 family type VII secretion target n=1 Tax=Lentzea rhizosphaerae TaxID=2041025 RepID=A0ABV8BQN8_9PSEU
MPHLKVDIAGAKQIATDLKLNAEARQGDLSTLGAKVNPANVWEGDSARAYEEKYEQWKAAELRLVEALRELGQVVDKIITNFDEINMQGAAALR